LVTEKRETVTKHISSLSPFIEINLQEYGSNLTVVTATAEIFMAQIVTNKVKLTVQRQW